jgi:hypothetical protein
MSSNDDPFEPAPGAKPVGPPEPFHTAPANSHNSAGSSTTTGLRGTTQKFDDGTLVTEAKEELTARRADGLDSSVVGNWRRVQKGSVYAIRQENYSYRNRQLPDGSLFEHLAEMPSAVPAGFSATAIKIVTATQFGKGDKEDEGTGSPQMGLIQTNSEVVGASVKISIMSTVFAPDWKHNEKRFRALIEVYNPDSKRMVRVPLVDLGPGEHAASGAEVDLTLACDQFLKTQGKATVHYRILVPIT